MDRRSALACLLGSLGNLAWEPRRVRAAEPAALLRIRVSDGTSIAVEHGGAGPSLLLVHGSGTTRQSWALVAPLLQPDFHTYAMDRRGHGDSSDGSAYSLAREAQDIVEVAAQLPSPVFFVGHSFGAIATLEALRLTETPPGAVLYEPPIPVPGGVPRVSPVALCARLKDGDNDGALQVFLEDFAHVPSSVIQTLRADPAWSARVQLAPTLCRESTVVFSYQFEPQRMAAINVRTMFLLGGDSPASMATSSRTVSAALPHSRLQILAGQKHDGTRTAPPLVAQQIREFLR